MEETAEQHLEELANRPLLEVVDRDYLRRANRCRIHDLLLDLAKDGGKNQFLDVHGGLTSTNADRSLSLAAHEKTRVSISISSCLAPNLRSLLLFNLCDQLPAIIIDL